MAEITAFLAAILTILNIISVSRALRKTGDKQADALEAIHHALERIAVALEVRTK